MKKSNNKLKLRELEVKSFVTSMYGDALKGGTQQSMACTQGACQYRTILIGPCAPNSGNSDPASLDPMGCDTNGPCQTNGGGVCPSEPPHCPTVAVTCGDVGTCG